MEDNIPQELRNPGEKLISSLGSKIFDYKIDVCDYTSILEVDIERTGTAGLASDTVDNNVYFVLKEFPGGKGGRILFKEDRIDYYGISILLDFGFISFRWVRENNIYFKFEFNTYEHFRTYFNENNFDIEKLIIGQLFRFPPTKSECSLTKAAR